MALEPGNMHQAADYWAAFFRHWPIAAIGGAMGIIMNYRSAKGTGWKQRVALIASEWIMGASAAMLAAMLMPSFLAIFPEIKPGIEAEIGFCGFIGGSLGRNLFRAISIRFFKIEMRREHDV